MALISLPVTSSLPEVVLLLVVGLLCAPGAGWKGFSVVGGGPRAPSTWAGAADAGRHLVATCDHFRGMRAVGVAAIPLQRTLAGAKTADTRTAWRARGAEVVRGARRWPAIRERADSCISAGWVGLRRGGGRSGVRASVGGLFVCPPTPSWAFKSSEEGGGNVLCGGPTSGS